MSKNKTSDQKVNMRMRWETYHLFENREFVDFWKSHLKSSSNVLYIYGIGQKSHKPLGLQKLLTFGCNIKELRLAYQHAYSTSRRTENHFDKNLQAPLRPFSENVIKTTKITTGVVDGISVTALNTIKALPRVKEYLNFDDIVVDVSKMPHTIALSALTKILYDLDYNIKNNQQLTNLHIVSSEQGSVSSNVSDERLYDKVTSVKGFSGLLTSESTREIPRIWFPILSEKIGDQLTLIHQELNPDEICPIVPFPSIDPRRGDKIVIEHRNILFDRFRVESRNIIRANEINPFEAYKQIFSAIERYKQSLAVLGGCKVLVTPTPSKILTIATFLSCYDQKYRQSSDELKFHVGIPYVEVAEYGDVNLSPQVNCSKEISLWVKGAWEK